MGAGVVWGDESASAAAASFSSVVAVVVLLISIVFLLVFVAFLAKCLLFSVLLDKSDCFLLLFLDTFCCFRHFLLWNPAFPE